MFKAMVEHYGSLVTSIKTMFGYKTSSLLGVSLFSAFTIETFWTFVLHGTFMGVPILLQSVVTLFILIDWLLGSAASRKLSLDAKEKKDKETEEKYKFSSIKISHTIFKFISLYLWMVLSLTVAQYAKDISWLAPVVEGITLVPILLFGFREFISIGEDVEVLIGYKPYLFEIGERIFDAFQLKFLKRLS